MCYESGGEIAPTKTPLITLYNYDESGPFLVLLESQSTELNLGNIHPIKIGRELKKEKIPDITRIIRKGKNRVGVEFTTPKSANYFIKSEFSKKNNLTASISVSLVTCREVPLDITPEELIETTIAEVPLLAARRLNKRVRNNQNQIEYIPTESVVATFRGKKIPKEVVIDYYHARVHIYIPPVIQCMRCLRYGHVKAACRGKKRCALCEQEHEETTCNSLEPSCIYCKDKHNSTSRTCPEFTRQKEIKELMAFENLSYFEARLKCPKRYTNINEEIIQSSTPRQNAHHYRQQEYPQLPKIQHSTLVEIHERRQLAQKSQHTIKPNYNTITRSPKRKTVSQSPPIDKKILRELTFPSSSRTPNSSPIYDYINAMRSQESHIKDGASNTNVINASLSELVKNIINQTSAINDTNKKQIFSEIDQNIEGYAMEIEDTISPSISEED